MGDGGDPIRISRPAPVEIAGRLGVSVAALIRYQSSVIDREDRLEAGTGTWLSTFREAGDDRSDAVRAAVLRSLQLGFDTANFAILERLGRGDVTPDELGSHLGLDRVTLSQRISDLVSAGLATKLPETGSVAATDAGLALLRLVDDAATTAERELEDGW